MSDNVFGNVGVKVCSHGTVKLECQCIYYKVEVTVFVWLR